MNEFLATAKPGPTFDAESMGAILDGRKTQTRREIKSVRRDDRRMIRVHDSFGPGDTHGYDWTFRDREDRWHDFRHDELIAGLPYRIGQVYYARESLRGDGQPGNRRVGIVRYAADGEMVIADGADVLWPWKRRVLAPHLMPRWAARVVLRITDVRVQRLGEITDADVLAEGIVDPTHCLLRGLWIARWEQVNGPGSWERDRMKWVAAYTFDVVWRAKA